MYYQKGKRKEPVVIKEKQKMSASHHRIALLAVGEKCWILLSSFTGSNALNVWDAWT